MTQILRERVIHRGSARFLTWTNRNITVEFFVAELAQRTRGGIEDANTLSESGMQLM